MFKSTKLVTFRDAETGRTKVGRIIIKPGRERDAAILHGMAQAAVQAAWEEHQEG